MIAVQHPDAKIEIFDCELSKYAMFLFQAALFSQADAHIEYTNQMLTVYVLHRIYQSDVTRC